MINRLEDIKKRYEEHFGSVPTYDEIDWLIRVAEAAEKVADEIDLSYCTLDFHDTFDELTKALEGSGE